MTEIVAVVEGPTEQTFVTGMLAEYLGSLGVSIWAVLPGKTHRHGGIRKWDSARDDIIRLLKTGRHVTTMFDYYGMPPDWPGRSAAAGLAWAERGSFVEAEIRKVIADRIQFHPAQLIPYVQVHEFEAVLFSDARQLACAVVDPSRADFIALQFEEIVSAAGNPEAINDGYETCPSRRIRRLAPAYRKALHGPLVARRIGLERIRRTCSHFAAWLRQLEALADSPG